MDIAEIRQIARHRKINPDWLFQLELIRAIQGEEGNFSCDGTSFLNQCGKNECLWRHDCQSATQ